MREQTFNTFWYGAELSPLHWACLNSFAEQGHRLRLFAYQELKLPPGTVLEDARQIIGEEEVFEFENSFSAFSDIFRCKLLFEQGGWWVDTDVYCLKEDIPDCTYGWAKQDAGSINNAILKFPTADPTLKSILDEALRIGKNVKTWGEIGPHLLTKYLAGREFANHYGSTRAFYPLHWLEPHLFWLPGGNDLVQSRCAQSHFVHLWGSMFRHYGIDISIAAPKGSFLHWMQERSGFYRTLAPLDEETQAKMLESVKVFLGLDWVKESWERFFDSDLSATVPALQPNRPAAIPD